MQKLYEYVVIYTPFQTKDQKDLGEKPKSQLLVDVTRVLADDDKQVAMLAARAIPAGYEDKLAQIDIAVRPF